VVAIGLGAADHELDRGLVAAVVLALLVTIGLWWTYFDRVAAQAEARLAAHEEPVLAAADAYSYLHLVLVTGIIVFAVGAKGTVAYAEDPLSTGARLALCGGVALYLAGHAAFVARLFGTVSVPKGLGVGACLVVFLATGAVTAWATAGLLAAVLALVVVAERSQAA
jgi:low temperature requirement protein LtrA